MGASIIQRDDIIMSVITSNHVCNIGMIDELGLPYVLPFNFGVSDGYIWFHCGNEGKKMVSLRNNPNICVAFSGDYELGHRHEEVACSYFMKYKSVLVSGAVEFIEDAEQKRYGMNVIMKHYTGKDDFSYNNPAILNVVIFRLKIENVTGRMYGI